jgi:hypothetical protein
MCARLFSARVHSYYQRRLAHMAVGGQELMIHLKARRFLCGWLHGGECVVRYGPARDR